MRFIMIKEKSLSTRHLSLTRSRTLTWRWPVLCAPTSMRLRCRASIGLSDAVHCAGAVPVLLAGLLIPHHLCILKHARATPNSVHYLRLNLWLRETVNTVYICCKAGSTSTCSGMHSCGLDSSLTDAVVQGISRHPCDQFGASVWVMGFKLVRDLIDGRNHTVRKRLWLIYGGHSRRG